MLSSIPNNPGSLGVPTIDPNILAECNGYYVVDSSSNQWWIEAGYLRYIPTPNPLFSPLPSNIHISNLNQFGQGVQLAPGTPCVQLANNSTLYLIDQGWLRKLQPNSTITQHLNTNNNNVTTLNEFIFNLLLPNMSVGGPDGWNLPSPPTTGPDNYSPTPTGPLENTNLKNYDGYVLKQSNSDSIYMVDQGYCRWIPDMNTYNNLYGDGNVWKDPGFLNITIQRLPNSSTASAIAYHCPTPQICAIPQSTLPNSLSIGACLVTADNQNYYLVDQGVKRWIQPNSSVFSEYSFSTFNALRLPLQCINAIPNTGNTLLPRVSR